MQSYGAWQLAHHFSDVRQEYYNARETIVMMDRSYFGLLQMTGKDHVDLLHRLTTNELRMLQPGQGQINIFTSEKGRIVDRVTLYKFEDKMWILPSPETVELIAQWIDKFIFLEDVKIENLSEEIGMISLFGPQAPDFLTKYLKAEKLPEENCSFIQVSVPGSDASAILACTEELNLPGFHLIVQRNDLIDVWEALLKEDVQPMGEAAYEVLRIEAGWPVYQKDYTEANNPHEVNFLPYVSFTKGCYVGQEVVARLDTYEKVQRYLMGLIFDGDRPPNFNDPIFRDNQEVGKITSSAISFKLNKPVAMGFVRAKFIEEDAIVKVKSSGIELTGRLVQLPFKF